MQLAGGDVQMMAKAAQLIDEHVDCDFVDINCGCPLDEVHKRGAGSRLMAKAGHLEGIVRCMPPGAAKKRRATLLRSGVLKTKALTLKMRTAHMEVHAGHFHLEVAEDNKLKDFNGRYAHNLVPKLEVWSTLHCLTLHLMLI